ncbi:MAG: hypothetical protein PHE53_11435 [Thermoguttaceae bacterium]|nr:hypothetical protein [Thermoguttaceae bacterium]
MSFSVDGTRSSRQLVLLKDLLLIRGAFNDLEKIEWKTPPHH